MLVSVVYWSGTTIRQKWWERAMQGFLAGASKGTRMAFWPAASNSTQGFQGGGMTTNGPLPQGFSGYGITAQGTPVFNSYTCACGSPATRAFSNPRGISETIGMTGQPTLYMCDACDFRHTVMRAAGRSEEFIADYEEKQQARAKAEEEAGNRLRELYRQQLSQQARQLQQAMQNAQTQQMQNAYNPARSVAGQQNSVPPQSVCTENVPPPKDDLGKLKQWWKNFVERKNERS